LRDHIKGFQKVKKYGLVKSPDAQVAPHPSSLQRTYKYASFLEALRALPAELFTQPSFSAHFSTYSEFVKKGMRKGCGVKGRAR
jgi:hypothetical protein